jgi:hypothetical protein
MVRIYANLQGLSKASARSNLCGGEARALAPFSASFTRAQELFDFVDAGDKKEGADFKIRGIVVIIVISIFLAYVQHRTIQVIYR